MSYNPAPKAFFGPSYALTGSAIVLPTIDAADVVVGAFTADDATNSLILLNHGLKIGDKVHISTDGTLPTGLTTGYYFVHSTTAITGVPATGALALSLTKGGAAVALSGEGTGIHTLSVTSLLREVDDIEADPDDGDFRKVVYGIQEMLYQKWVNTPVADRPTKLTVARASSTNESTGAITRFYTITIVTDPVSIEVRPE